MRKFSLLLCIQMLFGFHLIAQNPFTAGNLAVFKVGNGTDTLSSAGFLVNIDEFTNTGTFVQSHPMPTTITGANKRLISSGSASSEGQITRSVDKKFLLMAGYDTFPDPLRLSISGSPASAINRVVAVVSADGSADITTALTETFSANNFRGAASTNGTDLWLFGNGIAPSNGVRYTTKGATTSVQLSTTVTNIRMVNIFNNQLYSTSGSGAFKGVAAVGIGLPTVAGQTITVLPGFPNTTATGPDPYSFDFNAAGTIVYVADANTRPRGGGVQKWVYNTDSLKWKLAYTLDSGLTSGMRNIVVDWTGANPKIYGITIDALVKDLPGNKIVTATDIDSVSAFVMIAQADPNFVYRGIAFAPEAPAASTQYIFTGNGNWDIAANWSNGIKPPNPLTGAAAIIIDPITGGKCILNITQNINNGSSLTVKQGKELVVPGQLNIQ